MGCLRCGKDVQNKDVFCEECRAVMAEEPVKPGTVVVIPHREPVLEEKRSKRKNKSEKKKENKADKKSAKKSKKKLTPTEQDNKQLRRITRLLLGTAAGLLGAVCFLAYLLFKERF